MKQTLANLRGAMHPVHFLGRYEHLPDSFGGNLPAHPATSGSISPDSLDGANGRGTAERICKP